MSGTRMLAEIHEQPDVLRELCRRATHACDEWRVPKTLFRGSSSAVARGVTRWKITGSNFQVKPPGAARSECRAT